MEPEVYPKSYDLCVHACRFSLYIHYIRICMALWIESDV